MVSWDRMRHLSRHLRERAMIHIRTEGLWYILRLTNSNWKDPKFSLNRIFKNLWLLKHTFTAFQPSKGIKAKIPTNWRTGIILSIYIFKHINIHIWHTQFKCICVNECLHTCEILLVKYLLSMLCTDIITSYVLSILNKQLTVFY